MKTITLFLALFFATNISGQIIIRHEVVLNKERLKSMDIASDFTKMVSDAIKENYPVSLNAYTIKVKCDSGSAVISYEAKLYPCDQIDADFNLKIDVAVVFTGSKKRA